MREFDAGAAAFLSDLIRFERGSQGELFLVIFVFKIIGRELVKQRHKRAHDGCVGGFQNSRGEYHRKIYGYVV